MGLAALLLPLLPDIIVMVEKLIGKKKSPTDVTTGKDKGLNVLAIAQQITSVLIAQNPTLTALGNTEILALINAVVAILKPYGLDQVSVTGVMAGGTVVPFPLYSGTMTMTLAPQIKTA